MFAHAMTSTIAVIENSRINGDRVCACIELWPRRPSASAISFALNLTIIFIVAALIPVLSGVLTC